MQSLDHIASDRSAQRDAVAGRGVRPVLPRVLRKPFRIFSRLGDDHFKTPRVVWVLFFVAVFAISGISGWISNSRFPVKVSQVSAEAGFSVGKLKVSTGDHVSVDMIREALGVQLQRPLFEFDVQKAREDIEGISWVERAFVSKSYPDSVSVEVVEREPFAIWQTDGKYKLVDRGGIVMTNLSGGEIQKNFRSLPLVVGDGANLAVSQFLEIISEFPMIASRSVAYVRIGDRRWDLNMEDGITVMLPEKNVQLALAEVHRLQGEYEILSRDLSIIDLRLPDRLVLRISEEVAAERRKQIEEQLKALKAKEVKT